MGALVSAGSDTPRQRPELARRRERQEIPELLDLLARGRVEDAWPVFLGRYASIILQVARLFVRDEDEISECFLFCCMRLSRRRCRRLRCFDPDGPATFTTWLHTVVYNLCRDWRRAQRPRRHQFRSITKLPFLEQEVFHLHFERGMSSREALEELRPLFPRLSEARLAATIERLSSRLTPRQNWLLQMRHPRLVPLINPVAEGDPTGERQIPNGGPGPEVLASRREQAELLDRALDSLSASDRLILRLRFEQDSTLQEIAQALGLKNAQAADRRIRSALEELRGRMLDGKAERTTPSEV